VQAGVNLATALAGDSRVDANMVSQAFDEILTKEDVLKLVTPFLA